MGSSATAWEPVEENTKGWEPVDEPAQVGASPDDANWMISSHWAGNHPLTTSILKSFDIANVGKNVAQGAAGVVKGAYDVGKDLVQNPNWVTGPDSTYEKFVGAPAAAQAQQAKQLWQQGGAGNRVQAAGHELAGALPVVGPWAASLGTQAGTGDIGGAVGQGIGAYGASKLPELPGKLNEVLPANKRGGTGLGMMDKAYADLPIKPLKSYAAATELVNKLDTYKNIPVPESLREFVNRVSAANIAESHPEVAQSMRAQGIQMDNPLTFPEARGFREALNDLKYERSFPAKFASQFGNIAKALDDDIRAAAPHPQFLTDYTRFNKEYAQASKIQRAADAVGPLVGGTAGAALGGETGGIFGADVGARLGTQAGRLLGKPVIGGMVGSVLNRNVPPPSLTPPKLPASRLPREAYTRIMLRAKEGDITPTRLDQLGIPRMRRIPQPPEEP